MVENIEVLQQLEERVGQVVAACERLKEENRGLQKRLEEARAKPDSNSELEAELEKLRRERAEVHLRLEKLFKSLTRFVESEGSAQK